MNSAILLRIQFQYENTKEIQTNRILLSWEHNLCAPLYVIIFRKRSNVIFSLIYSPQYANSSFVPGETENRWKLSNLYSMDIIIIIINVRVIMVWYWYLNGSDHFYFRIKSYHTIHVARFSLFGFLIKPIISICTVSSTARVSELFSSNTSYI